MSRHYDPCPWITDHSDPLLIERRSDPLLEKTGHLVTGAYVEMFWLPLIGPSALWAARRLHRAVEAGLEAMRLMDLAGELGLSRTVTPNTPMVRTLGRLVHFGVAEIRSDRYAIRSHLAPLARHQLRHLPDHLQRVHTQTTHPLLRAPAAETAGGQPINHHQEVT